MTSSPFHSQEFPKSFYIPTPDVDLPRCLRESAITSNKKLSSDAMQEPLESSSRFLSDWPVIDPVKCDEKFTENWTSPLEEKKTKKNLQKTEETDNKPRKSTRIPKRVDHYFKRREDVKRYNSKSYDGKESTSSMENDIDAYQKRSDADNSSVLARYIERFRLEEPKSREERRKPNENDFWWLKDKDKNYKTLDDLKDERKTLEDELLRQSTESANPWRDRTILELQAKADKLIEKSSTITSENENVAMISTDGLKSHDSSDTSSHLTSISQKQNCPIKQYSRPKIKLDNSNLIARSNDILTEWRSKRRYQQPKIRENIPETDLKSLEEKVTYMRKELKSFTYRINGKQLSPTLNRFNRNTTFLLQHSPCSTFCHCKTVDPSNSALNLNKDDCTNQTEKRTISNLQTCSTSCQTSLEKIYDMKGEEMRDIEKEEEKFTKCSTGSQTNGEKKEIEIQTDLDIVSSLEIEDDSKIESAKNRNLQEKIESSIGNVIKQSLYGEEKVLPEKDAIEVDLINETDTNITADNKKLSKEVIVKEEETNHKKTDTDCQDEEDLAGIESEMILNAILDSDEEEFSEDTVLIKLREQRRECLERWKNYCKLLGAD